MSEASPIQIAALGNLNIGNVTQTTSAISGVGRLSIANGVFELRNDQPQIFVGTVSGMGTIAKRGASSWTLAGSGDFAGTIAIQAGKLIANGQFLSAQAIIERQSSLEGVGSLDSIIVRGEGELRPGQSPGRMSVRDLQVEPGGTLTMEIGGPQAGADYDQIIVSGSARLDGVIRVVMTAGYVPLVGSFFDLLTFASHTGTLLAELPTLGPRVYSLLAIRAQRIDLYSMCLRRQGQLSHRQQAARPPLLPARNLRPRSNIRLHRTI